MSAVFLNVGQCGNQLGQSFWQEVEEWTARTNKDTSRSSSYSANSSSQRLKSQTTSPSVSRKSNYLPYSLLNGTLPCLWVDTEPKVVKACYKLRSTLTSKKRIPADCCMVLPEGSGRGSNWAYGYHGRTSASSVMTEGSDGGCHLTVQSVEERLRKVVEKCDRFGGTILMHSLAGGTGAGLTSALVERIRDKYPLSYILSIPIAPFSLGDTPLQHYNSLLCLSWLQTYSDAVLLVKNDTILHQAQQLLLEGKGSGGGGGASRGKRVSLPAGGGGGGRESLLQDGSVSLEDMNKHISQVLCNSLMPIWSPKQSSPSYACQEPWELVRSLCPDPKLKFITPIHTESSRYTWEQATTNLLNPRLVRRKNIESGEYEKGSTLSVVLIARGSPNSINNSLIKGSNLTTLEEKLKDVYNTVKWNPFPVDFWFSYEVQLVDRKFATALMNGSVVCDYLDRVVHQARLMYKERAFLHWYERYGCENDTFKEAFDVTQTIIDNYTSLK